MYQKIDAYLYFLHCLVFLQGAIAVIYRHCQDEAESSFHDATGAGRGYACAGGVENTKPPPHRRQGQKK